MLSFYLVYSVLRLTTFTQQALYQPRALDVRLDAFKDGPMPLMTTLIRHDLPLIGLLISDLDWLILRRRYSSLIFLNNRRWTILDASTWCLVSPLFLGKTQIHFGCIVRSSNLCLLFDIITGLTNLYSLQMLSGWRSYCRSRWQIRRLLHFKSSHICSTLSHDCLNAISLGEELLWTWIMKL